MTTLPKAYDPAATEPAIYQRWMDAGHFHAEPDGAGEQYSIVIPPPNVTGSLHVGHALDNTIQDVLIRRARMQGRNAVWVPGTDHAGIATQMVVEKQLAEEGLTRHDLGREAFVERVWRWRAESGGNILDQLKKLGCSLDWEREAFTFDEARNRAVEKVFIDLYEAGLIYRGQRLINWDPILHTALSDIEVEHEDVTGELVHFRYPFADDPDDGIVVATTRAETMLGDTAVAVHPDDERWTGTIGRMLRHPFLDREIPVIADEYVDPEFGSGAVKITPAHDPNDWEIGIRHDLPMIDIMTDDAAINENGGPYAGLDRFEARAKVKEDLDAAGLLVKVDVHEHSVGHSSRSEAPVEPRLSDQWFVKVRPLAEKAIASVSDGDVRFVPERMTKGFIAWLENLHDWCISRQLWWGHRIPAWHHESGEIKVQSERPEGDGWEQDPDVLDTWFSSQLWPFVVFGWPDDTPEMNAWFPTSVLVTGYDINTFWVSRMLMISEWIFDTSPFAVVHNHGLVRDEHGKKMSKSFGNVIDPLELIDEYGADATRFALLRSASPGTDVPLAREWVDGEKRFVNKLFNAVRFARTVLGEDVPTEPVPTDGLALEDRWVLSRLEAARGAADDAYDAYEWAACCRALRSFAWDELADWYLEAVKVRVNGDDEASARTARIVLARVLEQLLALLHPIIPFVTESLHDALRTEDTDLMVRDWPSAIGQPDPAAEEDFAVLMDLVTAIRQFRSQNNVPPRQRFGMQVSTSQADLLAGQSGLVCALAGLDAIEIVDALEDIQGATRIVFSSGEAQVELAGLIDVDAECERLEREVAKATVDRDKTAAKLANESFVNRAPPNVVQQARDRAADLDGVIAELSAQRDALGC